MGYEVAADPAERGPGDGHTRRVRHGGDRRGHQDKFGGVTRETWPHIREHQSNKRGHQAVQPTPERDKSCEGTEPSDYIWSHRRHSICPRDYVGLQNSAMSAKPF